MRIGSARIGSWRRARQSANLNESVRIIVQQTQSSSINHRLGFRQIDETPWPNRSQKMGPNGASFKMPAHNLRLAAVGSISIEEPKEFLQ